MPEETDKHLSEVLNNQLVWKNPSCVKIAVRICQKALNSDKFYPEDIAHQDLPDEDVNCIGSLFKFLAGKKTAIIARTTHFKRSEAKGRRGSTVFAYTLQSRSLAESLVRRLGAKAENPQREFTL